VTRPLLAAVALAIPLLGGCGFQPAPANPPSAPASGLGASGLGASGFTASEPGAWEPSASGPVASTSWALAEDQSASAARAGLPMLSQEMLEVHYHAHIDLVVRGAPVQIPAGVGIDTNQHKISPLHTHDATGIVHIESGEDISFTLGQFFTEWGQPLEALRVGPVAVAEGERLRIYRDGKEIPGNPAAIPFTRHGAFYLWIGPAGSPPSHVASTYDFPQGL
jgi:hypothetical protein